MSQDFFNPWDARVAESLAKADRIRRQEILDRDSQRDTGRIQSRADRLSTMTEVPAEAVREETKTPPPPRSGQPNTKGYVCPVCWGIPKMLRGNGIDLSRHLPASSGAKLYRDTEFCNGQGRPGVVVSDQGWTPGSEAREFTSVKKQK